MVIQNIQNKITSAGKWFLNKPNFEPEICFTSLLSSLKYVVINLNTSEIITEGVLVGSYDKYRFNFKSYLTLGQNREVEFTSNHPYIFQFKNNNTDKFIFILDSVDILPKLEYVITAEGKYLVDNIYSEGEVLYSGGEFKGVFEFYDKYDDNGILIQDKGYKGTWFPITLYKGESIVVQDSKYISETLTSDYDSTVYLIYLNEDITWFRYLKDLEGIYVQLHNYDCKVKSWYYYGLNGGFNVLYTKGNVHQNESTEREYIKVSGKDIPYKQITKVSYTINTGFGLNEFELYDMIRSPYLFSLYQGSEIPTGENLIIDSLNVSYEELKYPTRLKHPLINDTEYIISLETGTVQIELISELNNIVVQSFELTDEVAFTIPSVGTYYLRVIGSATKLKLEYSFEGYIVMENLSGKLYKLEKMGKATTWIDDSTQRKVYQPKLETLYIVTDSFDGYKGKTLLNKNVELKVRKPNDEQRQINVKPNFFF